jgi:5'(3')-deoxyribonucleotidase
MINKVAIIDIDGVLSDYPNQIFFDFLESKTNIRFNSTNEVLNYYGRIEYDNIKNKFRKSGLKKNYLVRQESTDVINALRENEYFINIITSRPPLKENIESTRDWLNENGILFDQLFFVRGKASAYLDVKEIESLVVIDDEYKGLEDYLNNANTLLFKFGESDDRFSNIIHVESWKDIKRILVEKFKT